jgi:hypothetical protein
MRTAWLFPTVVALGWFSGSAVAPAPFHPHVQKKLEARIAKDVTVTVTYQTVTFDKAGAEKMAPGQAWHLANAHFETTADLVVGGHEIAAGRYSLKARKAEAQTWELVLDDAARFRSQVSENAKVLETEFVAKSALFEHLNIDVQPTGDKKNTTLQLDVRFDEMLARCAIVIPE